MWVPTEPIPVRLRDFGFFPNTDDWLPADLLLVAPVRPDWIHRQITIAQLHGGYAKQDAQWQHAAVYMGDGYVCEAGTSGVRYAPVFDYVGEHLIRVRRDPRLTPDERWRLAIQAVVRLGDPYDFRAIFSIYRDSLTMPVSSTLRAQFSRRKRAIICSHLYAEAYRAVTPRMLSRSTGVATPATLSLSNELQDVALYWKTIG
jgi:hypothetical protein